MGSVAQEYGFVTWTEQLLSNAMYNTTDGALDNLLKIWISNYTSVAANNDNFDSMGSVLSPNTTQQAAAAASILAAYQNTSALDIMLIPGSAQLHQCGIRRLAQGFATRMHQVYLYTFEHHPSTPGPAAGCPSAAVCNAGCPLNIGAYHISDVPFVFGNPTCLFLPNQGHSCNASFSTEELALSKRISSYWVNFIRTSSPNNASLPFWPAYSAYKDIGMSFTTEQQDTVRTGIFKGSMHARSHHKFYRFVL